MKSLPRPRKCRHCIRMTSGSCPYPAAKSVHRMVISCGTCELAVLDPHFKSLYEKPAIVRAGAGGGEMKVSRPCPKCKRAKGGRRAV